MALHLKKLCVGVDDVSELAEWQALQRARLGSGGRPCPYSRHLTRNFPRRAAEILDGGSLYWVVRGLFRVRQRIVGLERTTDQDGQGFCEIRLDPALVAIEPVRSRPFQGWRYLEDEDAPADLDSFEGDVRDMPPAMRAELRELGLI